ncbi:MAG: hypothetical protein WCO48_00605 [Candidatus Taylorbacteria bacterium]
MTKVQKRTATRHTKSDKKKRPLVTPIVKATPKIEKEEVDELKVLDVIDPVLVEEVPEDLEIETEETEDEEDMDLLSGDNW